MIVSFRHKGLENFFYDGATKGIQSKHARRLKLILDVLDAAIKVQDVGFPGARLHPLEPKSSQRWAVSVSGNWRVTFRFEHENAYEVDYEDYH